MMIMMILLKPEKMLLLLLMVMMVIRIVRIDLDIMEILNRAGRFQLQGRTRILNSPNLDFLIFQSLPIIIFPDYEPFPSISLHKLMLKSAVSTHRIRLENGDGGSGGGLLLTKRQLTENEIELGFDVFDLELEVANDAIAATNRIHGSDIGLKNNGAHCLFLLEWIEVFNDFGDVANAEEFMSVEKLALAIVREIGGENAIGSALTALVLAGGAGLSGGGGEG